MNKLALSAMGLVLAASASMVMAQAAPAPAPPAPPARQGFPQPTPLGEGPWDAQTWNAKLHVEVVARGLDHPWGMAFAPDGSILVTERPGRLRVIRDGVLDPTPIEGMPLVYATGIAGLTDIVLDPDFASNRLLYFSYSKPDPEAGWTNAPGTNPQINATLAAVKVARARAILVAPSGTAAPG